MAPYPSTLYARPTRRPDNYTEDERRACTLSVSPEVFRFMTYCFFWSLCILAYFLRRIWAIPYLEAGWDSSMGDVETKGCGPFNRGINRNPQRFDFIDYGDGFSMEHSHLSEAFGYNNICVLWDYSPSREGTAMYFPFFEYSMVIYLFLDFVNIMLSYRRGEVSRWFYELVKICTPINILLCAWFRLIFVFIAYDNPRGHTFGFLGLQIALLSVAISNVIYILMTRQCYPTFRLSQRGTRMIAWTYLVLNALISAVKLFGTAWIVLDPNGWGPEFYRIETPIFGRKLGQLIDYVWMFFNAVFPWLISYARMRDEEPFTIRIELPLDAHKYLEDQNPRPPQCYGPFGILCTSDTDENDEGVLNNETAPLNGPNGDENEERI